MQKQAGSILAAIPIWHAFLDKALEFYPAEAFTRPGPVTVQKTMLDGQYIVNSEVHSILYYVDKSDPAGPPPQNPTLDPNF